MAQRNRNRRIEICVSEEEYNIISQKMALTHAKSMRAYLTRMAIHGYMVEVDLSQLDRLTTELSRIGNNLNQLSRRANETKSIYGNDIQAIRGDVEEIKGALLEFFTDLHHTLDGEE